VNGVAQLPRPTIAASRQSRPSSCWRFRARPSVLRTFSVIEVLAIKEFGSAPVSFWLASFSDKVKGTMRELDLVVLPNANVVEPRIEKRLQALRACRLIVRPTRFPL
jgi:hypothetical protein